MRILDRSGSASSIRTDSGPMGPLCLPKKPAAAAAAAAAPAPPACTFFIPAACAHGPPTFCTCRRKQGKRGAHETSMNRGAHSQGNN